MVDPASLNPASRPRREPKAARRGWSSADVRYDELVGDEDIAADPDSTEVVDRGDGSAAHVE
jgi:hypothetical protein